MPASSAAASMARPSAASRANGFSHSTCLPAAMAARAMGAWVWGGVAMVTASTPSQGEGVVHRGEGPGDAEQAGALRRLGRVAADQGRHLEAGGLERPHVGEAAEAGSEHDDPPHRAAASHTRAGGFGGESGRLGGRPGLELVAEHLDAEGGCRARSPPASG